MQLTGNRIPDYVIDRSGTAGALFRELIVKPKPKKLVESLERDERLQQLENVRISPRRVTAIDKDRAVGRWKVIEEVLIQKGLPVSLPRNRKFKSQAAV